MKGRTPFAVINARGHGVLVVRFYRRRKRRAQKVKTRRRRHSSVSRTPATVQPSTTRPPAPLQQCACITPIRPPHNAIKPSPSRRTRPHAFLLPTRRSRHEGTPRRRVRLADRFLRRRRHDRRGDGRDPRVRADDDVPETPGPRRRPVLRPGRRRRVVDRRFRRRRRGVRRRGRQRRRHRRRRGRRLQELHHGTETRPKTSPPIRIVAVSLFCNKSPCTAERPFVRISSRVYRLSG